MHIVHIYNYFYAHDEQRKERSTTHNCAQQCISNVYYVSRDHLMMDISDDTKGTDHTFVDSELSHWLHLSG